MPAAAAQDSKLVSVILVNWNRLADVRVALRYLAKLHYHRVEVIVVDNGSVDGSVDEFRKTPGIKLIELGKNAGPCIARNVGIKAALGEFVFFLDSDAVLSKRALSPLVDAMGRDPQLAVIGCRIDHARKRTVDQWIYSADHLPREHQSFETYAFSAAGAGKPSPAGRSTITLVDSVRFRKITPRDRTFSSDAGRTTVSRPSVRSMS